MHALRYECQIISKKCYDDAALGTEEVTNNAQWAFTTFKRTVGCCLVGSEVTFPGPCSIVWALFLEVIRYEKANLKCVVPCKRNWSQASCCDCKFETSKKVCAEKSKDFEVSWFFLPLRSCWISAVKSQFSCFPLWNILSWLNLIVIAWPSSFFLLLIFSGAAPSGITTWNDGRERKREKKARIKQNVALKRAKGEIWCLTAFFWFLENNNELWSSSLRIDFWIYRSISRYACQKRAGDS